MTTESVYKTHNKPIARVLNRPGIALIVAGSAFLALTLSGVSIFSLIAPLLFVSGAGFLMMMPANRMESSDDQSGWALLAAPGAAMIALGSIIFVLDVINHDEAFSYLWTVIVISFIAGLMHARRFNPSHSIHERGRQAIRVLGMIGLGMGVIFELFVFETFGRWWPMILIGYGLYLLVSRRKATSDETL